MTPALTDLSASGALETALADPPALMVNRNAGSGTRVLIDGLLRGARPPGYANQPRSHNAVAAAIAQRRADWGWPSRRWHGCTVSRSCRWRRSITIFC